MKHLISVSIKPAAAHAAETASLVKLHSHRNREPSNWAALPIDHGI
jgi:hypothetical protein